MAKKPTEQPEHQQRQPVRPTVSIYQHPDHVAGILQQLFGAPLVVDEIRSRNDENTSRGVTDVSGHGGGKTEVSLPFFGKAGMDVTADLARMQEQGLASADQSVQNFTYSQAYYLYVVREELKKRGLLTSVETEEDINSIESGSFVEFRATFKPNALHAWLDIMTPDLIAAITRFAAQNGEMKRYMTTGNAKEAQSRAEKMQFKAQTWAEIALAAAEAIRVDFRAEKTREFYGTISETLTAVTICDAAHFVVEDEDRILDGSFTVLGKVTSKVEEDVPVLARNKVLDRVSPEAVDRLFGTLRGQANKSTDKVKLGDPEADYSDAFDLALPSRINGPSFKVMPIAIYA